MEKNVGIAVAALVLVVLACFACWKIGSTSDLSAENTRLQNEISSLTGRLEKAQAQYMEDMKKTVEKFEHDISEKEKRIERLNRTVDHYEGLYRTRTVVCIGLGAAVVGALFVGTFMGAKGRRDALRVCKDRDVPAEEVA